MLTSVVVQRRVPKDKDERQPKSSTTKPEVQKRGWFLPLGVIDSVNARAVIRRRNIKKACHLARTMLLKLIQVQLPQILLASLQARGRKRKQSQETEDPPVRIPAKPLQKRPRTSLASPAVEDTVGQETASSVADNKFDPIDYWRKEGHWPKGLFGQDSQTQIDLEQDSGTAESERDDAFHEQFKRVNMTGHYLLARKKSSASLRQQSSESNPTTSSDQQPREAKSAPYANPSYATILATKGSFMDKSGLGITDASKGFCRTLLEEEQAVPQDSLFRDDLFDKTCQMIQDRNEAMVVRDIALLIVPSAQTLATYGATHLEHLTESVNEGWNSAIPVYGPRPQPDYSVGFGRSAFTEDYLKKLEPFVGDILFGSKYTSHFMATWRMYFPFLTCEVKCGAAALDIADRQNAHSMTLAVRGIVELFRLVKREKELHREILAFSVSHDHTAVRIYGHYPVIDENKVTFYRHPIRKFDFTEMDGKDKWSAYKFTKNVYDIWMPTHFKRICSVVDELPSDINFELSQQSELEFPEASGLSQELHGQHLSQQPIAESASLLEEHDSQSSIVDLQGSTPNTSVSRRTERETFKVPKKRRTAE